LQLTQRESRFIMIICPNPIFSKFFIAFQRLS
jgi:hypothetical protein